MQIFGGAYRKGREDRPIKGIGEVDEVCRALIKYDRVLKYSLLRRLSHLPVSIGGFVAE
jgi:hypothetical protein